MKNNLVFFVILLGCSTPQKETTQETQQEPTKIGSQELLIPTDSIFPADFIVNNLNEWFEYNDLNNPDLQIDSFLISHSIQMKKLPSSFDVAPEFFDIYKDVLSYSPDSLLILDLFSNQVDLMEQANGKYGGMYTISVKGILWELVNQSKSFLDIRTEFDAFHDNIWINNRTVAIIGTTKIDELNDFSRVYKIWVLDFDRQNVQVFINSVSCGNYYVDEYIREVKLRNYETWLDEM